MQVVSNLKADLTASVLACALAAACSAPDQGGSDAVDDTGVQDVAPVDAAADKGSDQANGETAFDAGDGGETQVGPSARLRFAVDDSANKTYKDGQMSWTGSFEWSSTDNTIVPATSWLPGDGPYPPLYDDGPASGGGHEPEGAVKGDHVFETEVLFAATEDTTFEYGVLDEFDGWIWIGPNGTIDVMKGSTDTIDVPGLTIPAFGSVDFKVTLDVAALDDSFMPFVPCDVDESLGSCIYLKSSANSWSPVQLLDNGQKGDDQGGDGVYTYVQSQNLGPHDGLLFVGQHAQFVFSFAMAGTDPEDGLEYKVSNNASDKGVKAYSDHETPGVLHDEPVVYERDSRGKVFNTTIIIGDGKPWCEVDEDCHGDVECTPDGCGKTAPPSFKATPVLDGTIGADWAPGLLLASNAKATDWGPGENELKEIYAAWDDTHMYVGIKGVCGADNVIVAYVDADFKGATGATDMSTLSDDDGELDAAVSSKLVVSAAGFGADLAFGTKGMKSFVEGSTFWPEGDLAGWRDLGTPADFGWLQGSVIAGSDAVEAAIPLASVFPGGVPAQGAEVAIVVRIVNADGQQTSNQTLPESAAGDAWVSDKAAVFPVE